jgi:hypothetical protein
MPAHAVPTDRTGHLNFPLLSAYKTMTYDQLAREIERHEQWVYELARRPSCNDKEPADSQRQLLARDDQATD